MAGRWGLSLELPGLALRDHEPVIRAAEAAEYTVILGLPLAEPSVDAHVALVESLAPSG